jgi:aminoglycoside 3-N-acetyltransferase
VLIKAQDLTEPFAPLEALSERGGVVALMGVGLRRMTLLHLAEQQAGRTLLRRWALGQNRSATLVAVGGCSEGFDNFNSVLARIERQAQIGSSLWRVFEANLALEAATAAIVTKPSITHCRQLCVRCDDAVSGGPILD